MTSQQCTGYDDPRSLNRRAFLDRFGMGLGGIALANLLTGETSSAAEKGKTASFRCQGQAGYLLVSSRWSQPDRSV